MKRTALLALAMTAIFSGTTMASASTQHTKVVSDCQHAHYKPTSITLFCDNTVILTKIVYWSWGANVAKGKDRTYVDNCVPNCAAGKPSFERDTFTLDRAKTENGVRVFTRVRTYHNGKLMQTYHLSGPTS